MEHSLLSDKATFWILKSNFQTFCQSSKILERPSLVAAAVAFLELALAAAGIADLGVHSTVKLNSHTSFQKQCCYQCQKRSWLFRWTSKHLLGGLGVGRGAEKSPTGGEKRNRAEISSASAETYCFG